VSEEKAKQIAQQIAQRNDLCRTAMGVAGRLVQTAGISALPPQVQSAIRENVERFSDFNPDNDPHGERDFGAFTMQGVPEKIFWKIDYYADKTCTTGAEDPADTARTFRILTIMLASEY